MKRVNATARRKYSNDSALFLWCESLAASIPERGKEEAGWGNEGKGGVRRRKERKERECKGMRGDERR